MSAKNKLEALKNAFDKKTTTTSNSNWKNFFSFWKAPDDSTTVVRFLPDVDPDNSLGFLVENLIHEFPVNGEKKKVPCLEMYGHQCPVCALSRKYYAEKNEDLGKKYYRKKSYIGQVLVIESPIEHDQSQLVKLIEFGPAVFKQIQAAFQSGDLEEAPFELKGGYNFRIKKTKSGQYASYNTSSFAPKATDVEDDVIEQLNLFNLADFRGKAMDLAVVQALLTAAESGHALEQEPMVEEDATPALAPAPRPAVRATPAPSTPAQPRPAAVEPAAVEPAAGSQSKANSVLEKLRARARAAAESTEE